MNEDPDLLNPLRIELYNYSVREVAEELGVSAPTIYAFRSGRTLWPRYTTLEPMMKFLGYEIKLVKTNVRRLRRVA